MTLDIASRYEERAARGKYGALYKHLCDLPQQEWRTTFSEIESILGFALPPSARRHRPWWANQGRNGGNGHSHARAWNAAGWETADVDMRAETLALRPRDRSKEKMVINEVPIRLHIEPLDEGDFLATSPDVPGLVVECRSLIEAVEIAQDLTRKIAEICLEYGDPMPPALASPSKIGAQGIDLLVPVSVP